MGNEEKFCISAEEFLNEFDRKLKCTCSKCGRRGLLTNAGTRCGMTQPSGEKCDGIFLYDPDESLRIEIAKTI